MIRPVHRANSGCTENKGNLVGSSALLPHNVTGLACNRYVSFAIRGADALISTQHTQGEGQFPWKIAAIRRPGQLTGNQHIGAFSAPSMVQKSVTKIGNILSNLTCFSGLL
jgi:hypothetical protein